MKNRKKSPLEELFESLFSNDESFFVGSITLKNSFFDSNEDESGFPKDGDENFNKTEEVTETGTHSIKKEVWTSLDGAQTFQRTTSESKKKDSTLPGKEELKQLRDKAVAEHRYEDAAKYRDELAKLKK